MSKYLIEFPVVTGGIAEIDFDGDAEELREAIKNGDLEIDYQPRGPHVPVLYLSDIPSSVINEIGCVLPIDLEINNY